MKGVILAHQRSARPLRSLARTHFWILVLALFGYLAFIFVLGPGFLAFDVSHKIRVLADEVIVVTAAVLGPPAVPVVVATPVCSAGSLSMILDWADDTAATGWDIERDGSVLSTGLAGSQYIDTAVAANTTYSYVVTAFGPMSPGVAFSVPVSAHTIDCASILPPAILTLTALESESLPAAEGAPITLTESRPRVKGNTNIANALIDITLTRPSQSAHITANANGYFVWKPPRVLKTGRHTLVVTATDPADSNRTISTTLEFFVEEKETEASAPLTQSGTAITLPVAGDAELQSFDFWLSVTTPEARLKQGERLDFSLKPKRGLFPSDTVLEAKVINERGETLFTAPSQKMTPASRPGLLWSMDIPVYLPEGAYSLQIEAVSRDFSVTRSAKFLLEAQPFIRLEGGRIITYADVANYLGWILFMALGILVFFSLFLVREYWLYLQSARHVTERELRRFGMIPWRKEVDQS